MHRKWIRRPALVSKREQQSYIEWSARTETFSLLVTNLKLKEYKVFERFVPYLNLIYLL